MSEETPITTPETTPAITSVAAPIVPQRPFMTARIVWAIILFVSIFSIYMATPPSPRPSDAPETEFSAYRAIQHDYIIAKEPHPAGSPANEKVQNYICDTMRSLGIDANIITDHTVNGRSVGERNMVLARIPGTENTKAVALMSHYDSVPYGPGGADDGAGVISLIEVARALKASPPLKNDVIFVFTDAEENGKLGVYAFSEHPWFKEVGLTVNLEARGTQGNSLLFGTSDQNGWLIDHMIHAVRYPTATSLMYDVYKRMPFSSDFDEIRPMGMKGFDIAFIDNFSWYHTKNDKPEHLNLSSLQQHGMYALDMARHFGSIPLTGTLSKPDAMYFNVIGPLMVHYPINWAETSAIVTSAILALAFLLGRIRKHISIIGVLLGAVIWAFTTIAAAAICIGIVVIVWGYENAIQLYTVSLTRLPDLYPLYQNNLYVASFAAVSIAVAALVYGVSTRWIRAQTLMFGAYVWWTAVMWALTIFLPGGSYLVMWPLFFSALGMFICFIFAKPGALSPGWILFLTFFTLPALTLMVPTYRVFGYTVMVMAAPGLSAYVSLLMGLLIPQFDLMGRLNRWCLPLFCVTIAGVLVLIGVSNSRFSALKPKLDSVSYGVDYDAHRAFWLSADREPDEWTSQFFPPGTPRLEYGEFFGASREKVMKSPAPISPEYPGPEITLLNDAVNGDARELTIHIASPAKAARLDLKMLSETEVISASVFDKPIDGDKGEKKDWQLRFNLFPKNGADVTLRVPAGNKVKLCARETFYGLPEFPGFAPRPDYIQCTPNSVNRHGRSLESNRIYIVRSSEF